MYVYHLQCMFMVYNVYIQYINLKIQCLLSHYLTQEVIDQQNNDSSELKNEIYNILHRGQLTFHSWLRFQTCARQLNILTHWTTALCVGSVLIPQELVGSSPICQLKLCPDLRSLDVSVLPKMKFE